MTYKQLAQQALDVQDASNLSGVVHAFSRGMDVLWAEARLTNQGIDWINRHPIVTLFIDKLASLNHTQYNHSAVLDAYPRVREISELPSASETTSQGLVLTGAQVDAIHRKFEQNPDGHETYVDFRDTAHPMVCGQGAVVIRWAGMWLAIETDGHTHS